VSAAATESMLAANIVLVLTNQPPKSLSYRKMSHGNAELVTEALLREDRRRVSKALRYRARAKHRNSSTSTRASP